LILKLIFGVAESADCKRSDGRWWFDSHDDYTIPFSFRVAKSDDDYRTLSVPHPRSQIRVSAFYRDYGPALLYFAGRSPFSIRKPVRVGKYSFAEDQLHAQLRATWATGVSESRAEYETFQSYFAYERYSNIYKFYESPEYQGMEKRYKHLLRLDISRCFESIYTHSVGWAVHGKATVKDNYATRKSLTFPERFDVLMQKLNYNETNGILVGSEFSRLFAETILQAVDGAILRQLEESGVVRGRHFEILRYVDDYFVFFDRIQDETPIKASIREQLKEFGLSLNGEKEIRGANPDITPISIAKTRISSMLESRVGTDAQVASGHPGKITGGKTSTALITDYKTIIKETGAPEKDVINYSLGVMERLMVEGLKHFAKEKKVDADAEDLAADLASLVEFAFFVYTASPKVNPTVKLCRIAVGAAQFVQNQPIKRSLRARVLDAIFFEIRLQLNRSHGDERLQVEKLYLLSALSPLGDDYLIPPAELEKMYSIEQTASGPRSMIPLNHFALTTLLHYAKGRSRFADLRAAAEAEWIRRVEEMKPHEAERVLLILDAAASPYLGEKSRLAILLHAGLTTRKDRFGVMRLAPTWFTRWRGFDLGEALDLKRNQEVY
jgi:hypothetical protein